MELKQKIAALLLAALIVVPQMALAQEEGNSGSANVKEEAKEEVVTSVSSKEITGQVGGISKDYIGVTYLGEKNIEYEMGIYIEGTPELERIKNFAQIQIGDTVTVKYDEVSEMGEDGKEIARHVAKKIIFVKKAPPPAPEKDALISDEGV